MHRIDTIPTLSRADALWRLFVLDMRAGRTRQQPPVKRRALLASQVGARVLQRYDLLRETKDRPVVRLENGTCTGCGQTYPRSHAYAALEGTGEIRGCVTCGRLIAFLEPTPFASIQ